MDDSVEDDDDVDVEMCYLASSALVKRTIARALFTKRFVMISLNFSSSARDGTFKFWGKCITNTFQMVAQMNYFFVDGYTNIALRRLKLEHLKIILS